MVPMVIFDCGQKRQRFAHFQDDPAKHDGHFANFATSMAKRNGAAYQPVPRE